MKEYLYTKVNSIVEKMVVEILKNKPEHIHDFMIEFLEKDKANVNSSDVNSLANAYGEFSDEEAEEEDEVVEIKKAVPKKAKSARQSVSAEAFGKFN